MSTALTMGTFDLLHPGHLRIFEHCRQLVGDDGRVVATVNDDAFVASYKGRPPVMGEWDRCNVVAAVRWVDHCFIHRHGHNAVPSIDAVGPDLLVIGADWLERDYHAQLGVSAGWLESRGISVVYVPLLAGKSSTALRAAMA